MISGAVPPGVRQTPVAAAVLIVAALTLIPACSDGAKPPRAAALTPGCLVAPQAALQADAAHGLVPFVSFPHAQLPGSHGLPGHPLWMYTQFRCGLFNGFLATIIMAGPYRAQDDALARSLHYHLGKWPLVPFYGDVISLRPHAVLEVYEGIYQFRSVTAAEQWLQTERYAPQPHTIPISGLPSGFIARSGVAGPDDGRHEHEIGVNGRMGQLVLTMGFQGGRSISWTDVQPLWDAAWRQFETTLRTAGHATGNS